LQIKIYICIIIQNKFRQPTLCTMTKASKERLLMALAKQLAELDYMITENSYNENAVKSLQEQYKKLTKILSEIRDSPTTD
jgi:hypothetical protein